VKKEWIEDCFEQKKRLPEKDYSFNKKAAPAAKASAPEKSKPSEERKGYWYAFRCCAFWHSTPIPSYSHRQFDSLTCGFLQFHPSHMNYSSNSDDDDDGGPNEYDLNDEFLVPDDVENFNDSSEEEEDIDEVFPRLQ
jgi:hypothetical protein